mmetsp:Transcript_2638/g.8917  ORF Transcript_2638/g.8917 Transcript_2638/m.8917 type:complete len:308 (-) Transcript_2638:740-1663(-)
MTGLASVSMGRCLGRMLVALPGALRGGGRSHPAPAPRMLAIRASSSLVTDGVVVVQGASKGIGLEMCRQVIEGRPTSRVVATCRNPEQADALQALAASAGGRMDVVRVDVTDVGSMESAARLIAERHGGVDALINVAGILHIPGKMRPETSLLRVEAENMMTAYQVNAMGPTLMTKALWELIMKGAEAAAAEGRQQPVVANVSARVSSIGDNGTGGWHSYRASKTALNQLSKNVAIEMSRKKHPAICILLHPGTTATDLSQPFQKNVPADKLFTPEFTARQLLGIVEGTSPEDNGKFYAWDGSLIEW